MCLILNLWVGETFDEGHAPVGYGPGLLQETFRCVYGFKDNIRRYPDVLFCRPNSSIEALNDLHHVISQLYRGEHYIHWVSFHWRLQLVSNETISLNLNSIIPSSVKWLLKRAFHREVWTKLGQNIGKANC